MSINAQAYSRPAKFSTIVADADLDIGARAILTTDLSLYQGSASAWFLKNRAKTNFKNMAGDFLTGISAIIANQITEQSTAEGVTIDSLLLKDNQVRGRIITASNDVLDSEDAEVHITAGYNVFTKYHEMDIPNYIKFGKVRVSGAIKSEFTTGNMKIKWMVNDVISLGGEQTQAGGAYGTKTEDIYVQAGDHIEWWLTDTNHFFYAEIRASGVVSQMPAGAWNLV